MAVLDAQGATLTITDGTTPTTVAKTIGGLVSFDGFDGEASDIDITTLASTAKEYRQGLRDFGSFTIQLMRDPNDEGQVTMAEANAALATRQFVLTLPSTDVATFNGYVKSLTASGGVDAVVTGQAAIKITGEVVWS